MGHKLSVVIPVYNEERTIHLILDKVRQVTMPAGWQKEIIIVNDCSKDNTEGAIKKYMGEHPDFPMRNSLARSGEASESSPR